MNIFYGNDTILWFDPLCQWFLKHTIKTIFKKHSCNPPKFRARGQVIRPPICQFENSSCGVIRTLVFDDFRCIRCIPAIITSCNFLNLGPVVQRPITANPWLNCIPGFFISLYKSSFQILLSILCRASYNKIVGKKN